MSTIYVQRLNESAKIAFAAYQSGNPETAATALEVFTSALPDIELIEVEPQALRRQMFWHYSIFMNARLAMLYADNGQAEKADEYFERAFRAIQLCRDLKTSGIHDKQSLREAVAKHDRAGNP